MESILERQRHAHEDIERLEQAVTERILAHPRTIRDRLQLDHEIAEFTEKIQLRSHTLKEMYADSEGYRAKEIAALSAAGGLETFYSQLAATKEFHKRYPDNVVEDLAMEYEIRLPDPNNPVDSEDRIARLFSGEEGYGRFFDLTSLHSEFVNLKRNRTISYLRYLDIFDTFSNTAFPEYVKQDPKYADYLTDLSNYLQSYYKRTTPLDDHAAVFEQLDAEFEKTWTESTANGDGANAAENEGIWCDICQKQYSKQTVYDGHLNSKKHKAGLTRLESEPNGTEAKAHGNQEPTKERSKVAPNSKKELSRLEHLITELSKKFSNVKSATKANVARKQTLTDKEWQAEQSAGQSLALLPMSNGTKDGSNATGEEAEDDGEEGDKIYNPLKLPLGWDGKPIPFWLWRLHGLGVEYPCEICGNFIYMGRKAFDRHFLESRHIHGLRCLGISTNNKLFDQITVIADAVNLHERLETARRKEEKLRDENVEMEDESGNVMSEKVYNDLVAQGIL